MRGWSASASASEAPSFTRCFTAPITFLSRGCSICSTSAVSDSGSVMPAPISVASCRVAMARSCAETRAPKRARRSTSRDSPCPLKASTFPAAATAAAPSALRASVRKMPSLRRAERSALRFSASLRPRTDFPVSVRPLYSNTGILLPRALSEVLLGDAEHLGALDAPAVHLLDRQLADGVVDHHRLVDAGAPVVSGAVAGLAPLRPVDHPRLARLLLLRRQPDLLQLLRGGQVRLAALLAEDAHQALRQHADQGRPHQVGLDAHVDEAGDGARGVVGVDGAEDEVAGQRGLDGDLRRLAVADLADHDHVRVLAEEAAQPVGEGEVDLRVHRRLRDALELVLDRVLDGHDVEVRPVDLAEGRVERGGLAAPGGPRHQHDPVRLVDQPLHGGELVLVHPDLGEVEQHRALVEQAHDDALAEHGGRGGEADVDVAAGELHADAAVLRQALLRDVQAAHDLHARADAVLEPLRRPDDLLQHAVHPEAHADVLLLRLDVDVAGALLGGAEEQRVDQPDDGRLVAGVEQVLRLLQLVRDHVQVAGLEIADQLLRLVGGAVVDGVDAVEDGLRRHQHRRDAGPEEQPNAVQRARVERVGDGHQRVRVAVGLDAQRYQLGLLGEVDGHELDQLGRDLLRRETHLVRQLELRGERLEHLLLAARLEGDQDLAEPAAALGLQRERLGDLLLRHRALRDEDLADGPAGQAGAGRLGARSISLGEGPVHSTINSWEEAILPAAAPAPARSAETAAGPRRAAEAAVARARRHAGSPGHRAAGPSAAGWAARASAVRSGAGSPGASRRARARSPARRATRGHRARRATAPSARRAAAG